MPAAGIAVGLLANTWHSAAVSTRSAASAFASAVGRSRWACVCIGAEVVAFISQALAAAAGAAIAVAVVDTAGHLEPSASHGGRVVVGPCRLKR